jgi:hypothetical protein
MSTSNSDSTSKPLKTSWSLSTLQVALIMLIGGSCFLIAVWAYGVRAFGWVPLDLWSICTTAETPIIAPSTSVWEQSLAQSENKENHSKK